jgi:hypothetical protein
MPEKGVGKGLFTGHKKSSALLVSLLFHGILMVIAVSFVAVTVIQKEDQTFVAQTIKRPRIKLRKLSMPVKMEKKRKQKPKLRKRIVVKKEVKTPEIRMPEISGIKGGVGYLDKGGGGFGGLGQGLGHEINFFGIMGGGKHVVFIIDYSLSMGGEKEEIMRREAARVISKLPQKTEFGVIFFAGPAWPANSGLKSLDDWVSTGKVEETFRPKDWGDLPRVRYQRASRGAIASMIRKVEKTPLVYGTVYDCPIYMALKMNPMPDTIFFMTDGMCPPQRGIDSVREMIRQLEAAGKKVPVINTVGFGISGNYQLKQMAELTGGECNFLTAADYNRKYGPPEREMKAVRSEINVKETVKSVAAAEYPVRFSL